MTQGLIIVGDVLDGLARLDDNSVDAVVTDPPYELAFMGSKWDATGVAFRQETWEACLRVLKPGGHLIAFGGGRTHHRMWCAIEDAGFEVRDLVCWLYGCLSEDTELLTTEGWVRYHRAREGQHALAFNLATGRTCWEPIQRVYTYPYSGRMLSLRSEETDQLLTPNHKVVLAAHGGVHYLPGLRSPSVDSEGVAEADQTPDMLIPVQRSIAGQGVGEARAQGTRSLVGSSRGILPTEDDGSAQSSLEGRRYHFQEAWELLGGAVRQGARVGATNGSQGRLCHGASPSDGGNVWLPAHAHGGGESREPYAERQPTGEPDAVAVKPRSQALRVGEDSVRYAVPPAAIMPTLVDYAGVVWCIAVPSGAFVARRNGKVFVTGNSGFPKSLNVSAAIDKAAGAERKVVGPGQYAGRGRVNSALYGDAPTSGYETITAPATDEAKQWDGWGTALKPAVEPILLARKPLSEPTVAANVLKWGTGALAIDATRIGTTKDVPASPRRAAQHATYGDLSHDPGTGQGWNPNVGRWPANVIFECTCDDPQPLPEKARKRKNEPTQSKLYADAEPAPAKPEAPQGTVHQPDCPAGMLDAQSSETKSTRSGRGGTSGNKVYGAFAPATKYEAGYDDQGGASRFFYCSKASRAERERGLEDFEPVTGAEAVNRKPDTAGLKSPRAGAGRSARAVKNPHPTVKPIALMRWLVRLVTPPGGLVLDPFCGSGSTLIAAREEGHDFVGVDLSPEYCRIAEARVGGAQVVAVETPEDTDPEWEE